MKRRISKNPTKAAKQRAALKAAGRYKKDRERALFGSQGAAGPVKHIRVSDAEVKS